MVDWNEYFYYKDGKLYNKASRRRARKDEEAGFDNGNGYRRVSLNGTRYRVHRIIWELHNGEIPSGMQIDHIDQDRSNNNITNLRVVTNKENLKNQGKYKNNTSGVTGVCWHKRNSKWIVKVSRKHIGSFDDLELAGLAAKEAREKQGYHENHGI